MYSIYNGEAFNGGKQNQQCKLHYQVIKHSGSKNLELYIFDVPQSKAFKVTLLVQMYKRDGHLFMKINVIAYCSRFFYKYNFIKINISLLIQISKT